MCALFRGVKALRGHRLTGVTDDLSANIAARGVATVTCDRADNMSVLGTRRICNGDSRYNLAMLGDLACLFCAGEGMLLNALKSLEILNAFLVLHLKRDSFLFKLVTFCSSSDFVSAPSLNQFESFRGSPDQSRRVSVPLFSIL